MLIGEFYNRPDPNGNLLLKYIRPIGRSPSRRPIHKYKCLEIERLEKKKLPKNTTRLIATRRGTRKTLKKRSPSLEWGTLQ
jgi:hypothetical protein